jgi:GR25 family glycosyltransferase involved in LPS biosynthesis
MDFYCLHHTPALERKEYMNLFFHKFDINPIWIESFLPNEDQVKNFKKVFNENSANSSFLNDAEISLYLKHKKCFESIKENNRVGVILEDDVEIPDFNFKELCDSIAQEFLNDGDLLFIGSIEGMNINDPNHKIVSQPWMRSRCAHCYMVNPKRSEEIYDFICNIKAPFDWQLNYAIENLKLKVYWSVNSVSQRTQLKKINSLLR